MALDAHPKSIVPSCSNARSSGTVAIGVCKPFIIDIPPATAALFLPPLIGNTPPTARCQLLAPPARKAMPRLLLLQWAPHGQCWVKSGSDSPAHCRRLLPQSGIRCSVKVQPVLAMSPLNSLMERMAKRCLTPVARRVTPSPGRVIWQHRPSCSSAPSEGII
jgi:hypothetical protein